MKTSRWIPVVVKPVGDDLKPEDGGGRIGAGSANVGVKSGIEKGHG